MLSSACLFAVPIANRPRRRVIEDFGMRALASAQGVFISWIALTTTSGVCQLMHWLQTEALPTLSQFQSASHVEVVERQTQLTLILFNKFLMAMVQCKECGAEISENANTCPHCGDVIKEPKPKFSLLDLIQKISVPVVLSVAGTLITILTYFSMEGERQMEQTRKLLADAFDKDPIKQQYCIFYVDHLLASGRISPEMTVSVLSTVAANATNENVRLDALRMMPQLVAQQTYQKELKPLLVRGISSLIPNVTEVEVLRRQLMLDIHTLVDADESYRKALITELSAMDLSWSFINNKAGGNPDQKQIRIGLQIKLALLSLVQDYRRLQEIAAGVVDLANRSTELSKFVSDQLNMFVISSPRTALRVIAGSTIQSLNAGNSLPRTADEGQKRIPPVFIVAADDSQQMLGEKLAQALEEKGITVQGVDVKSNAKEAKLVTPENLEIRFSKGTSEDPFLSGLAEAVKRFTGEQPKLVSVSNPNDLDPGNYEIWFPKR
jgi:rRNA maturation protein Nop10